MTNRSVPPHKMTSAEACAAGFHCYEIIADFMDKPAVGVPEYGPCIYCKKPAPKP